MNWGSAEAFWHMGGHGFFVWGSYALTLALMLAEPLLVAQRARQARRAAAQRHEDESEAA
jgi:heme exporter protein D